jgi:hypothetical protein
MKQAELDYAISAKVAIFFLLKSIGFDLLYQITFANSKIAAVEYRQRSLNSDSNE